MDVISAIKSGKRFKPKGTERWFDGFDQNHPSYKKLDIPMAWLIRDNWEIEESEPEITISRTDFLLKMRSVLRDFEKAEQIAGEFGLG